MFVEGFARGPGEGVWGSYRSPRLLSSFLSPTLFEPLFNTAPSVSRSTWTWWGTPDNAQEYLMSRGILNGGDSQGGAGGTMSLSILAQAPFPGHP